MHQLMNNNQQQVSVLTASMVTDHINYARYLTYQQISILEILKENQVQKLIIFKKMDLEAAFLELHSLQFMICMEIFSLWYIIENQKGKQVHIDVVLCQC